jgi:hypothetical protein
MTLIADPSWQVRVDCNSSITVPLSVRISSRTRIIGKIADVAARSISAGVEALRPHLRRILARARASIIVASWFRDWMMITVHAEIIAIPDKAVRAIIAAILFVSAATANDPALSLNPPRK